MAHLHEDGEEKMELEEKKELPTFYHAKQIIEECNKLLAEDSLDESS